MAFSELLRILVEADTKGAVRSVEQLGQSTNKLSKSEQQLDRWGTRLTTIGAGLVGVGAAALVGLGSAARSAVDLGEAVNATNVTFGDAVGTVDKYAETSAKSMGLSERAYRQALVPIGAMLQNVGFDQEEAADQSVKLAQRAADMASVFNTDVSQALEAIQAGLRGEADPLERFGVGLNEAAVNAKAMELGLAGSTTEVDASAKAQARLALIFEQTDKFAGDFANTSDSLANRQRVLAAEFENLKASIGEGALPVFETFASVASGAIHVFQGVNDATGGMASQLAAFGAVGAIGAGGLSIIIGQAIKMRSSFREARDAVASFAGSGGLGRLAKGGLLVGGLLALDAVLEELIGTSGEVDINAGRLRDSLIAAGQSGKVSGELAEIAGEDWSKLKEALATADLTGVEEARKGVEDFAKKVPVAGAALDTGFSSNVERAKATLEAFDSELATITANKPETAFNVVRDAARELGIPVDDLIAKLPQYSSAIGEASAAAKEGGTEVDEYGRAVGGQADETDRATEALENYRDSLHALADPLFAALDASRDVEEAVRREAEARAALKDAIKEHGANSAEAAEATRELEEAQLAQGDAALNAQEAMVVLKDAMDDGTVTTEGARQMIRRWAEDGYITAEAAAFLEEQLGDTTGAAQTLGRQRPVVYVSAAGIAETNENFRRVKRAAELIPGLKRIVITADGSSAVATANGVKRYIDGLTGRIRIVSYPVPAGQTFGGGQQHGGPVRSDKWYVVGEDGPEVFIPNQNGMVVPNRALAGLPSGGGGGGGGTTIINNFSFPRYVGNRNELVAELNTALDRGARIGRNGARL